MNIAIIDADLIGKKKHRFPNLACMKISAYYKKQGYNVQLITDYKSLYFDETLWLKYQDTKNQYIKEYKKRESTKDISAILAERTIPCFQIQNIKYDKIFISKVFTDTEIDTDFLQLEIVEYGGTGFFYDKAPKLSCEIEHHMPDYHLYDEWVNEKLSKGGNRNDFKYYLDYSIGFTTRGCFRQCEFCVNRNYKKVEKHSPLDEFVDDSRRKICLLDDNVLGSSQWKEIFEELQATDKPFQYKQGMDERLLTDEKCEVLFSSKYDGDYIFAFDNIADYELIERKLQLLRKYTDKYPKFYVFCGFDREDKWDNKFWEQDIIDMIKRIKLLMKYHCLPYIMRFNRYIESPYQGVYKTIGAWCNQPSFFKKKSLREFGEASGIESARNRYIVDFEKLCPEFREYMDMKW